MSDIILDVQAPATIQLDAGTADPVARDAIAALDTRVEAIETTMPDAISYIVTDGDLTLGLIRTED